MREIINNKIIILAVLGLFLLGSGTVFAENISDSDSELEAMKEEILKNSDDIISSSINVTTATQLLAALPEPEEKPGIAVYHIIDKTGQHTNQGSSVVSQGASDMMITALMRSRQFKVIDRVNFNDFMNEQNLQTNNRFKSGAGPEIGELSGADYIIDGAVTEYQVDKETGGLGLNIAGIGGNEQRAVAKTAVDIRLTDTTSGEVVWSKSLKGDIKGEKVGIQAFSFLGDNIVEFETGSGKQEVINLVLRTLIEEAVFMLSESEVWDEDK